MVSENTTIYLRTTGDDSNGGYSSGDAFLTPARAVTESHKWMVSNALATGQVLAINVGEGTFNVATTIYPAHIHGANIVWNGVTAAHTALTINNIDGAASTLLPGQLEYIDFDVTFAGGSGAAVGQFILVKVTSGGTNPNLVKGCHKIIAYSANVATVRCVRVAGATILPSGTITANVTLVKTVFDFISSTVGIFANDSAHCGIWNNMVIKGDLVQSGVWMTRGSSIILGVNFGTSEWLANLNNQSKSNIYADGSVHSYGLSHLATLDGGGFMSISGCILSGCWDNGLRAYDNGMVNFQNGQMACGGTFTLVRALRGGFINAILSVVEGCKPAGSTAFHTTSGGGIDATSATDDAAVSKATDPAPAGNGAYIAY
jgi:hypothetical protein